MEGEGNCELAGPERHDRPGGAFEATFPTAGRDAGATPPPPAQAAGPLGKPFASQNCPPPYQGESGGLEPAMKPMAGQAGAPRGRGPSAEGPPLRGRSALTGGPVPPCAPLPSGGDFNFRSPEGEGNCEPAGATPPQPATGRGRFWADVSPLGRMQEMGPKRQPGTGGVAPAGTKILPAFGFQDFIAFFCPGSILRERGTT